MERQFRSSLGDVKELLRENKHFTVSSLKLIKKIHKIKPKSSTFNRESLVTNYEISNNQVVKKCLPIKVIKEKIIDKKLVVESNSFEKSIEKEIRRNTDSNRNLVNDLNLNRWEEENLTEGPKTQSNFFRLKNPQLQKKKVLNIINTNSRLYEFYHKSEKEEEYMILQNINFLKKFDFNNIRRKSQISEKMIQSEIPLTQQKIKKNVGFKSVLTKYQDMIAQIELNKSPKIEEYKNLMREKITNENEANRKIYKIFTELNQKKKRRLELEIKRKEILIEITGVKENLEKESHYLNKVIEKISSEKLRDEESIDKGKYNENKNEKDKYKESQFLQDMERNRKILRKQSKLRNIKAKAEANLKVLNNFYHENLESIEKIEREIKTLKMYLHKQTNERKSYYQEILFKGIDVRTDGLSWVVKKLMEFNCEIEIKKFPFFLEKSHIEYLIRVSELHLELYFNKLIVRTLKNNLKSIKSSNEDNIYTSDNLKSKSRNNHKLSEIPSKFSSPLKKSFQTVETSSLSNSNFNNFFKKEEFKFLSDEMKLEDEAIEMITENLKKKMKNVKYDHAFVEVFLILSKMALGSSSDKQRKCFEDILEIRNNINLLEEKINQIRENEIKQFRKMYNRTSENYRHDLIYSALFGNGIFF